MNNALITAELGSISSGTMRAEDLISTFASELENLIRTNVTALNRNERKRLATIVVEAYAIEDFDSEDADYILEDLFDALEVFAPDGAYFGANEGDGADYGFWPIDGE